MKMTSAYANKVLKKLYDDKEFLISNENQGMTYVASTEEEPVIPEYDYVRTASQITEIDEKIVKIKHAINLANATNTVRFADREMTVDMILVCMAQMNNRVAILDRMRKYQPKSRVDAIGYGSKQKVAPEYRYTNYDIELVKKDYEAANQLIAEMQLALDKYNQTVEFEVDM